MNTIPAEQRLVGDFFGCIDSQDWHRLSSCFHDDIVYERPGYEPLVGKEAVLDFYRRTRVVASGRHMLEQVLRDGDHIACWGRFCGIAKDGRELDVRFADVYRLENGLISRRRTFFDSPAI